MTEGIKKLRCFACNVVFEGEDEALKHKEETNHSVFVEVKDVLEQK